MAGTTSKEILGKVYKMIPPMLESFHKGTLSDHEALSLIIIFCTGTTNIL